MFATAREAARNNTGDIDTITLPSQLLPEKYSFSQLHSELASDETLSKAGVLENILVLRSCLEHPSRLDRGADDENIIEIIASWISKMILPDGSIIARDDIPSDSQSALEQALEVTQRLGLQGLKCLQILLSFHSPPSPTSGINDPQILLSAITFTSSRDTWTSSSSRSIATNILSVYSHQTEASGFIIDFLLQSVVRPLFSKSKPEAVTSTGRKAMPSSAPPKRYNVSDASDPAQKPWKYTSPYSIPVLEWVVENSSEAIISQSWNLFIPPLLTLLDDPSTPIRSRGLSILSSFLPKFGRKLLEQTGLGEVFDDAVMPTLMFLPSITPADESVQLLGPAYEALFVLGDVRWGVKETGEKGREQVNQQDRMKFYDRVMRKGILMGYMYANEHPSIVELLIGEMGVLVEKMGVNAVKHLKDIIPILSALLTDPFASSPKQLLTVVRTLKSVILACWPRISQPAHRLTILKSLVACWKNIEGSQAGTEDLQRELKGVARLFVKTVEATQVIGTGCDIQGEVGALVEADSGLGELFGL